MHRHCLQLGSLLLVLTMTGCARERPVTRAPMPSDRPPDFALAVTVASAGRPGDPASARYVVEPDGILRADDAHDKASFPTPVRRLTARQLDGLWRLARDSGLLEPDNPLRITPGRNPVAVGPATTIVVYVAADGSRGYSRLTLEREVDETPGVLAIVGHLSDLAWTR